MSEPRNNRVLTGALLLLLIMVVATFTPALAAYDTAVNAASAATGPAQTIHTMAIDSSVALLNSRSDLIIAPQPMTAAPKAEAAAAEEAPAAAAALVRAAVADVQAATVTYTVTTGALIWPAEGMFSSPFGMRWGRMHEGIDIASALGTPVYAADGGRVAFTGNRNNGYGNLVIIVHDNGTETWYAHCDTILAVEGERVAQGAQIATMGSTGFSTGVHLHFEVHVGGVPCDPINYLP